MRLTFKMPIRSYKSLQGCSSTRKSEQNWALLSKSS